jgi:lauroyl/myristoyl acyltransferase
VTAAHDPVAPPHAPKTGRLRRLLGDFHVTGVFWYRFHLWGVATAPRWWVGPFISLFTTFFFFTLFNIRRAIASNLNAVLGPCGWWTRQKRIYRTMWDFAWCLTERYEAVGTDRRAEFTVEGRENWDRLVERGTGFILVTAHIGNWELGSALPSTQIERTVHLVREDEVDPKAREFIRKIVHEQAGPRFTVHFVGRDGLGLGTELLSALRRGEIVAVQGDRPATTGRASKATLFGRPVSLPAGPAALARAAGVPLLPVFIFREGRLRSRLVLPGCIEVPSTGESRRAIEQGVEEFASRLEWAIRQRPHQWFCFRELWPQGSSVA